MSDTASRHYSPNAMRIAPLLATSCTTRPPAPYAALLINPFYAKDPHASYGKHVLTPTLALTSIAAATPKPWSVQLWDENLLQGPPPTDPAPCVVGITVHVTFAYRAYELADWYRRMGATVVLGGLHVTACPEEAASHADVIAIGDGVQTWPRILRDIEHDALQPCYESGFRRDYWRDPPPARHFLQRNAYLTTTSLIATRGCHNRCDFCYLATDRVHMPYGARNVQQVADEFERDGQPYGVFTDNNLGANRQYLRDLCGVLRPLGKIWSAAVSLDITDDPSLLRDMARAGCTGVFVGLETLDAENLDDAHKKGPRPEDYGRRVELFHDYGIQVNASFVFGFDHDKPDVFDRTVNWIEQHQLECATFHILTPYPGTPLFRRMDAQGRLLHKQWRLYDTAHAVYQPRHMTPEELEAGYDRCYRRLFSHASIWKRRPSQWSAVPAYLAMCYLYKRSNRLWPLLIRHGLTHRLWRPLIELSRRRHLRFRRTLDRHVANIRRQSPLPLSAGV